MTRFEVIILPAAEHDIGEAYEWIVEREPDAAIKWYNQLLEIIFSLGFFPERCPLAPESKTLQTEIREIFHGRRHHKYRILFTVTKDKVHVLHVRHGARLALGESETSEE